MFDIDECELRYDRNSEEGSVVCDVNSRFFFCDPGTTLLHHFKLKSLQSAAPFDFG